MNKCLKTTSDVVYGTDYPIDVLNIILEYISNFNRISTGEFHSVIIREDGTLHSWGWDKHGQVSETPKGSGFISVSSYLLHSIALKDDGTLHSWGDDTYCQISGTPKGSDFISIFTGLYHSGALKEDGTCVSWGSSSYDYLPRTNSFTLFCHSIVMDLSETLAQWLDYNFKLSSRTINKSGFTEVSPGAISVIVLENGILRSWIKNGWSSLLLIPGEEYGTSKEPEFTSLSTSKYRSYVLKDDGTIIGWVNDRMNILVNEIPKESGFLLISSGLHCLTAVARDGTLHSWGHDTYGQISGTPKEHGFISVSVGSYHSIALKYDGTIISWGDNTYRQISDTPHVI